MPEIKTAEELEREKQLADEAAKKLAEEAEAKAKAEEEAKNEKSPYELYLETLESEIEEKDKKLKDAEEAKEKAEEIARQKGGALKEEREAKEKLKKEAEELSKNKGMSEEELNRILDERDKKREEIAKVNQMTQDAKEREAILKTMSLKKVSAEDAYILVNAHIVKEHKENESVDDDSYMASIMSSSPMGGGSKKISKLEAAASDGLTEAERKHLKT